MPSKYIIKCDDCKATIGETDSLQESAAGGQCDSCSPKKKVPVPNLSNEFVFHHSGDRSVGISGEAVFIRYEGDFIDPDYRAAFLERLSEAFRDIFDNTRVRLIEQHEHTCRYCQQVFQHLDECCNEVCPQPECQAKECEREVVACYESEVAWAQAKILAKIRENINRAGEGDDATHEEKLEAWSGRLLELPGFLPFDAFEMHPCITLNDKGKRDLAGKSVEQTEDEKDCDFYSVYGHLPDGGLDCLADFQFKLEAEAALKVLNVLLERSKA